MQACWAAIRKQHCQHSQKCQVFFWWSTALSLMLQSVNNILYFDTTHTSGLHHRALSYKICNHNLQKKNHVLLLFAIKNYYLKCLKQISTNHQQCRNIFGHKWLYSGVFWWLTWHGLIMGCMFILCTLIRLISCDFHRWDQSSKLAMFRSRREHGKKTMSLK